MQIGGDALIRFDAADILDRQICSPASLPQGGIFFGCIARGCPKHERF